MPATAAGTATTVYRRQFIPYVNTLPPAACGTVKKVAGRLKGKLPVIFAVVDFCHRSFNERCNFWMISSDLFSHF